MTAKELETALTGRKVGMEITSVEFDRAADAGLVVVFGYSDDNVEFRGAIDEEVGAWNGTTIHVTPDGLLEPPACSDDVEDCTCPYFAAAKKRAKIINALWHDKGGPCWTFETDMPHETFTVMEDGEPFCEGIVFSMADLENKEQL